MNPPVSSHVRADGAVAVLEVPSAHGFPCERVALTGQPGSADSRVDLSAAATPRSRPLTEAFPLHAAWPIVLGAGVAVVCGILLRCSLATSLLWQIDELPLMLRATGLTGKVANEAEATTFAPSLYTLRQGALRSLRAPRHPQSLNPTAAFWANLTTSLFGVTPLAARLMPLLQAIAAIGIAAWLARLYGGGAPAAWISASVTAMSPLSVVYGAQVRGYAEASAMAGLLLIALAYLHRKPDSLPRLLAVWLAGQIAAVTVITTWGYWVLPVLIAALLLPPSDLAPRQRAALRRGMALVIAGLLGTMSVYVIDRWESFTLQMRMAEIVEGIGRSDAIVAYLADSVAAAFPWPAMVAAMVVAGLWRAHVRSCGWLAVAVGAGMVFPALKLLLTGDVGFTRTFIYLLVPLAALAGIGAERCLWHVGRVAPRALVGSVFGLALAAGALTSYGNVDQRARSLIRPDWSAMLARLDESPAANQPRWICPCLTYHWLLAWYHTTDSANQMLGVGVGDSAEIVVTATARSDGRETVFREDHALGAIVEGELPAFLAAKSVWRNIEGVSVRRWPARRVASESIDACRPSAPVLLILPPRCEPRDGAWTEMVESRQGVAPSLLTFKAVPTREGPVRSLLAPAAAARELRGIVAGWGSNCREGARWFVEASDGG